MKINDIILTEGFNNVDMDWVHKNCSDALERYMAGYVLYRGDHSHCFETPTLMTPNSKPRRAAYAMYNLHNDMINSHPMFAGFPKREIIMTTYFERARAHRNAHVALPVNGAKIGVLPKKDIFYSFKNIKDLGYDALSHFYEALRDFLNLFNGLHKGGLDDISQIKQLFSWMKNEMGDELRATVSEILISAQPWDSYYKFKDLALGWVNGENYEGLIQLFEPINWEVRDISQINKRNDENHECWTDSPVVLISSKTAHEFLPQDRH